MEPIYRTGITITWKEYLKFHMTDYSLAKFFSSELLTTLMIAIFYRESSQLLFLLLGLSLPLILFITYLLPRFLIRRRYLSCKLLQDMKLDYKFYPTFFSVQSLIGTEVYPYKLITGFIETKTNLYLRLESDQCFILAKADCPDGLIKYLFSRQKEPLDLMHMFSVEKENLPKLPKPFFETVTLFPSARNIQQALKYASLEKNVSCTKLPLFLLLVFWVLIYAIQGSTFLIRMITERNFIFFSLFGLFFIIFLIAYWPARITLPKRAKQVQISRTVPLNISFYDNYLYCTSPGNPPATYEYKNILFIKESPYAYYFLLSKNNYVIVEKGDCSQDLIDYIEYLKKKINT